MLGRTTARVRLPSLSKPREYCSTIAVPGDRVTSATRDARDKRRPMHTVSLRVAGDVRFPCLHAAANTPVQQLGVFFAHLTPPFQPSPIWPSGRPAHRPFRGLLGVHSRCGLHTSFGYVLLWDSNRTGKQRRLLKALTKAARAALPQISGPGQRDQPWRDPVTRARKRRRQP
jgi:hypothetical protein